jgi:uncharacterized protein (TIGR03032 family)
LKARVAWADMWARHSAEWRDTAQVASQWREAAAVDSELLASRASGNWWDTLESSGMTLFVTREYEHLVMALSARDNKRRVTYFPLPHPSGLTTDRKSGRLFVASSRNPNQVFTFQPAIGALKRQDVRTAPDRGSPLVPVWSAFYPGCLYLHDLALVGDALYGNAAGHNAIVRLEADGTYQRVWWPKCIETTDGPAFDRNYIQLNSIAAGGTLKDSYFSASSAEIGRQRPGHLNYRVDGRGVILSGHSREPICRGLTRPHSARLHKKRVWVANSGYGEVGYADQGRLTVARRLSGWTRGLCLTSDVIFVGTSRVIPRFAHYAPGVQSTRSRCGVHAICRRTGAVLGSIEWPAGNQIFAIDWMPADITVGFPFGPRSRNRRRETTFFYSYSVDSIT